ncbi:MAG: hypothetical protein AB8H80_04070 [Planctomycetota bacterium]
MSDFEAARPDESGQPLAAAWRARLVWVLASVAGCAGGFGMWHAQSVELAAVSIALHVGAALMTARAVRLAGAAPCVGDIALLLALIAPIVGPAVVGVTLCWRPRAANENAHAAFESTLPSVVVDTRPNLEHELRVVSHAHVLRHGTLEEKRNLLRQLGRIGEPRYAVLLRRFLRDPEAELRLCAYAELAHIGERNERRIRQLRDHADEIDDLYAADKAAALSRHAEACFLYATSGALDDDMAEYWLEKAHRSSDCAMTIDAQSFDSQRISAMVMAEVGLLDRAWQIVGNWPTDLPRGYDLLRAEIGFRRRDRRTCEAVSERLLALGQNLPEWLDELFEDAAERAEREIHSAVELESMAPDDVVDGLFAEVAS